MLVTVSVYLLTPWSKVLLEKLTGFQPVKKLPAFYGTRRFINTFTSTHHISLTWASSIQSITPHRTSWRSINVILPPTPGSPKWSLSFRFPHQNPVYASPLPYTRYRSRPSHSSRFYHPRKWGVLFGLTFINLTKKTSSSWTAYEIFRDNLTFRNYFQASLYYRTTSSSMNLSLQHRQVSSHRHSCIIVSLIRRFLSNHGFPLLFL